MRNLISFIIKYNFILLFLIFESISFLLVFKNNFYQQTYFFNFTKNISGNIHKNIDNIFLYFSLAKTNQKLVEENTLLKNRDINLFFPVNNKFIFKNDTLYKRKYTILSAKVINNSVNKRNNYLTIDKGSNNGIKPDMGVITNEGVVGIINNVSYNFSTVISLLNNKAKISAKIKRNNYAGTLIWSGNEYNICLLKDIPLHVKLFVNDTIITSGYSSVFPPGISLGTILYYKQNPGDNFYTIYIKLKVDFKRISDVYIIDNILQKEQELLEKRNND